MSQLTLEVGSDFVIYRWHQHPRYHWQWYATISLAKESCCCDDPNVCGNSCPSFCSCHISRRQSTQSIAWHYFCLFCSFCGLTMLDCRRIRKEWWVPKWRFWVFRHLGTYWHNTTKLNEERPQWPPHCNSFWGQMSAWFLPIDPNWKKNVSVILRNQNTLFYEKWIYVVFDLFERFLFRCYLLKEFELIDAPMCISVLAWRVIIKIAFR